MRRIFVASLACLIGGCVSVPKQAGFDDVQKDVAQKTGVTVQWRGTSADDAAIDDAVRKLLDKPLAVDDAVQIALLNNRSLQATYETLGIAQADLVQAGLLKNPVFTAGIRFPDRSPRKTYLDFSVEEDFIDLILLPTRKKLAEDAFAQTKKTVAGSVLQVAADTRSAFFQVLATEQQVELRQNVLQAQTASFDAAKQLHDAGNTNDLSFLTETSQLGRTKLELASAEEDATEAHEHLTDLMGLWGQQTTWSVAGRLADPPEKEIQPMGLETLAIKQRPDLEAARQDLLVQARVLGFTDAARYINTLDIGPEFERETDGQWRIGPSVNVAVPIFDQGQAAVARAAAVFRQSQQKYYAAAVDVRSQVRSARSRMFSARERVEFFKQMILPVEQKLLHQTQLQFNGMYVGVFDLLAAKREQIESGKEYIDALRDYWVARSDLERAVGGRLPQPDGVQP